MKPSLRFSLTEFSVRHHAAVLVLCVGLLLVGIHSYLTLPRENFPDIEVPHVFVTTVLDGANPTDVEISVTIPLETELDGVEGMKEMRSSSFEGMSMISIEFFPEVGNMVALQRVRDRIDIAKAELPAEAEEPVVKEFSFSDIPILIYNLVGGDQVSRSELHDLGEKLQDQMKLIPGVLDVETFGGRERQVLIEVDPNRLHYFNLSLASVQEVLRGTNRNVSAGTSESGRSRIVMRVPGEFKTPGEIFELVIGTTPDNTPIYVRDVATVRFDFEDETTRSRSYDFSDGGYGGGVNKYVQPMHSVSLHIKKRSGENTLDVVSSAQRIIDAYPLPAEVNVIKTLDMSKFVNMMISDLENGVLSSLILILVVIFIGLGGRNALLVAIAVPFSMLLSFVLLKAMGLTLNMIVLFSLILSLGMLVDNAIVIVENIYRYHGLGHSRASAAMKGTAEVAWPVIASTATTVAAFFPLLFWPGIMGDFMGYLPRTVIVVLLSSLFVALVVNPTLAALLMKVRKGESGKHDPESERPTYRAALIYQRLLEFMLYRPLWTATTAVVLLILTVAAYSVFGAGVEFFPESEPDTITCSITPPEGISLDESDRLSQVLEDRIFGAPGSPFDAPVKNLLHASVTIGLEGVGGVSDPLGQSNAGPIRIELEFVDREFRLESSTRTIAQLRNRIEGLNDRGERVAPPLFGAEYDVITPEEGPPTGKPLSIDIFGEDLNVMTRVTQDMKRLIANTEGAAKPTDNASTAQPTLEWRVDRPRAGVFGLTQGHISSVLQMAVGGVRSGTFGHGDDEQDILIRLPEAYRNDTNLLKSVGVPTLLGGSVPIASVANAEVVPGPVTVRHYNRRRVVNASAEVQPGIRADASIRDAFQKEAVKYPFPAGITYRFGGAAEEQEAAQSFLLKAFGIAILLIVLILVIQFNSVIMTGIVMSSVLLSLMGVYMGLLALRAPFGIIMTGIGVISLAGVVVNNAIVLLDAVQRFEAAGQSTYDAIVTACMIRFRPVLLTAVTTILGLIPMAIKLNIDFANLSYQYNTATSQFWQSMACAVIFGLLVATVLTLGVVPTLYLLFARFRAFLHAHFGFGRIGTELEQAEIAGEIS